MSKDVKPFYFEMKIEFSTIEFDEVINYSARIEDITAIHPPYILSTSPYLESKDQIILLIRTDNLKKAFEYVIEYLGIDEIIANPDKYYLIAPGGTVYQLTNIKREVAGKI